MKSRTRLIAAGLLAAGLLSGPAAAAPITYDFSVAIDSGALAGQTFTGRFSFDDAALTHIDSEYLPLLDFDFDFLGLNFTLADALAPAEAAFWEGNLIGIGVNVPTADPVFGFVPGLFDVTESYFAYEASATGDAGFGSVAYAAANSVPEPGTLSLMFAGLALAGGLALRRA